MTLPTRTLGPTGIEVSLLGLGGMPMSISGRPAEAQSIAVIHRALELGVTLIDTADVYCLNDDDLGHNERVIAKALATYAGDRSRVLVATKGGLERPNGAWTVNGRPAHLRQACERSLRALHVERIALYQLHAVDDRVPIEDSVGELARLRTEGKIEHVGLSNVDAKEIDRAIAIAPIVSVQNRFHVRDRRGAIDNGALAKCQSLGLAFLPYSPVGGSRGKARLVRIQRCSASPANTARARTRSRSRGSSASRPRSCRSPARARCRASSRACARPRSRSTTTIARRSSARDRRAGLAPW
jgi:aryl-alcohol dehydrogenase-like predicted oxidoreductase